MIVGKVLLYAPAGVLGGSVADFGQREVSAAVVLGIHDMSTRARGVASRAVVMINVCRRGGCQVSARCTV